MSCNYDISNDAISDNVEYLDAINILDQAFFVMENQLLEKCKKEGAKELIFPSCWVRMEIYVYIRDERKFFGENEKKMISILHALGMDMNKSLVVFERSIGDVLCKDSDGRYMNLETLVPMMSAWVKFCAETHDYYLHNNPVAVGDNNREHISNHCLYNYGIRPEEAGFSVRAGAKVAKLNCGEWFSVNASFALASTLGASIDSQVADRIIDLLTERIKTHLIRSVKGLSIEEIEKYPV